MLFNTIEFIAFFLIVFLIYWASGLRVQNILLLVASYYFYGCWNWKFLFLIFFSTLVDYICGLAISRTQKIKTRKILLFISVACNLTALGFFKYFNFFLDNLKPLFPILGISWEQSHLNIVLPVGISFYTFQSLSYTIDIYRGKIEPEKDLLKFALYVAFFPQLVAGPIERAARLLPQIRRERVLARHDFFDGLYLFYFGLFKKVFIADNLAEIVNRVFSVPASQQSGFEILLGVYAFAFQIYGDFSGYSDMARGIARMLGFELMLNFRVPYLATNPREFWQRWHISLSSWLRDYLYIPLGGNRRGALITYRNIALTMLLGGLWHGAAWTFIIWGAYQGLFLIAHRLLEPSLRRLPFSTSNIWRMFSIFAMFQLTCIGWLIFRADSFEQLFTFFHQILVNHSVNSTVLSYIAQFLFYTWSLMILDYIIDYKNDELFILQNGQLVKLAACLFMGVSILLMGNFGGNEFIYFQF